MTETVRNLQHKEARTHFHPLVLSQINRLVKKSIVSFEPRLMELEEAEQKKKPL